MIAKASVCRGLSILFVMALVLAVMPPQAARAVSVLYVKPDGTGDCSSWASACTLHYALTIADGWEIWVAAGTHLPTTGEGDRGATFLLKPGVAVYGGFPAAGGAWSQRDPAVNVTILSGDVGKPGDSSDNSYHVVTGATGATLDGFTITAGNANGVSPDNLGGGMYNDSSSPALTNVTFMGNTAAGTGSEKGSGGGGMYNHSSSPTLTSVTFISNTAGTYGGGMYNIESSPALTNVTFISNTATSRGGGLYNDTSNPILTNVTLSGNSATGATGKGGAMYNANDSSPAIRNTLFWGNTAPDAAQIANDGSSTPIVSDSVVQGGYAGANIITADPKLGMLGDYGGATQTIPLQAGSAAIDTGNNATCAATDQRGVTRPQGAACDIGAYEFVPILLAVSGGLTSGLCQSWTNACELRFALTSAVSGQEIWAAAGAHKPATVDPDPRKATFLLKPGVAVYGGFPAAGGDWSQRNATASATFLSGDIGAPGNTDNSYHVVTGATGATLDGFTITAGNASGGTPNDCGGGMYNQHSNPTLTNLTFSDNAAGFGGGGICNTNDSYPTLTNVTFNGNSAQYGGGMFNQNFSSPTLTNVTFSGDSASYGGGMGNYYSNPTLTNLTFSDNTAGWYGGGIYNFFSSPALTNVTFSGNTAGTGGGIYNFNSSPTITNTIFWGNAAAQIHNDAGSTASVSHSVVEGGYVGGTNIITTTPMLGTLGNYGGATQTIPLQAGSSAINATSSNCPATDQRGVLRSNPTCDIGAYEVQTILLAVPGGQTGGICESWANACELRFALTSAVSGQEIWAAAGTYKPTADTNRAATFQLKDGVAVYGGFPAAGGDWSQRNATANATFLSGDIGAPGNSDNSYHVVTGATGATLDGFTISAGNANGDAFPDYYGGGMYNNNSSPALTTVTFSGNSATYGGGMYNDASSPALTNVTFSGNTAYCGGGMDNYQSSSPTLTNVTFNSNSASHDGGGMFNFGSSSPTLTNVTFNSNSAASCGGGMYNDFYSIPTLTNVTFNGNPADCGGGMFNSYSSPTLNNVTFSGNAAQYGGGMYNTNDSSPTITNTIFWGNAAAQIHNAFGSTASVSHSVVEGGYAGITNIIADDPKLGTLGNYGGATQTIPLLPGSSAINATSSNCPATDQRGVPRSQPTCDIGAYEVQTIVYLPLVMRF